MLTPFDLLVLNSGKRGQGASDLESQMEPEPMVHSADEWTTFTSVLSKTWLDVLACAKLLDAVAVSRACVNS